LKSAKAKEGFDLAGLKMMERPIWAKSLRRLNFFSARVSGFYN
jgi:hypothetical protein